MIDLQVIHVTLSNLDGPLPIQAVRLRPLSAVFYEALGGKNSPIGNQIHSLGKSGKQEPAPYAISPLFNDGNFKGLRIATLQYRNRFDFNFADVTYNSWHDYLREKDDPKKKPNIIRVGSARMKITNLNIVAQDSYEGIWMGAKSNFGLELKLETPTRFLRYKQENLLPSPQSIWYQYLIRWNIFTKMTENIPFEFLTWVEHQVHVMDLDLETNFAYVEGTSPLTGVMGNITFNAFREKKPPTGKEIMVPESKLPNYLRTWQALARLGEYCGTGENANIGMGRTSITSSFGLYRNE